MSDKPGFWDRGGFMDRLSWWGMVISGSIVLWCLAAMGIQRVFGI